MQLHLTIYTSSGGGDVYAWCAFDTTADFALFGIFFIPSGNGTAFAKRA